MSGWVGGELDYDEPLRGDADGELAVAKCKFLRREGFSCRAKLGDLLASWEWGAAHRIKGFDHVAVIGIQTPDLDGRIRGYAAQLHGECL